MTTVAVIDRLIYQCIVLEFNLSSVTGWKLHSTARRPYSDPPQAKIDDQNHGDRSLQLGFAVRSSLFSLNAGIFHCKF